MKALLLIALLVCCTLATEWTHNGKMYNDPVWSAPDWEASQNTLYTAASYKGAYEFGSTWAACNTPALLSFDADAIDVAFQAYLTDNANCLEPMSNFGGSLLVRPFAPVSFQLVQCYKDCKAKFAAPTTAITAFLTCLKTSLTAVGLDVDSKFFFSEKLAIYKRFGVIDTWAESDWTYATLGGFNSCVEKKCMTKFFDEDFTEKGQAVFTTAWGRAYHIEVGAKIDASCTMKLEAAPKAGTALSLKDYNDCFKAIIPHLIGQDRQKVMCYSVCANPPSLFKGPYGPNPVVNSTVDGELYTSSSDGEFIREKAKILNDLVTCTGKISTFDNVAPVAANAMDQTNYFDNKLKYTTDAAIGTSDSAYNYLKVEASSNDEMRMCLFQNIKCRKFQNFINEEYKSTLFFSYEMFGECIDQCFALAAPTLAAFGAANSSPLAFVNWQYRDLDSRVQAKEDYKTCNSLASIAWKDMISKRNEKVGATILTAAALIMTVLSFVF